MTKPSKTTVKVISPPEFAVGDIIASERYMGAITGAFFTEGAWHYNIGENADLEKDDERDGHRVGMKFIRRSDIKWRLVYLPDGPEWQEVK